MARGSFTRWRLQTEVTIAVVARCRQRSICASALRRWRQFAARQAWLSAVLVGRAEGLAKCQLQAWRAWARRRAALGRLLGAALERRRRCKLLDAMQHWQHMARSVTLLTRPAMLGCQCACLYAKSRSRRWFVITHALHMSLSKRKTKT